MSAWRKNRQTSNRASLLAETHTCLPSTINMNQSRHWPGMAKWREKGGREHGLSIG